jgi:hypothetical protein
MTRRTRLPILILMAMLLPSVAYAQYFPSEGQRGAKPDVDVGMLETRAVSPVRFGIGLQLGSHIPFAGDVGTAFGERFTPTLDIGGTLNANFRGVAELSFGVHGFYGGLETDQWQQAYGLENASPRHLWVGLHGRIHPFAMGNFRPMLSFAYGGNRVAVTEQQPNGEYTCSGNGNTTNCRPDTERSFAGGYWGQTFALGGGFRVDPKPGYAGIGFVAETLYGMQRYGRQTVTASDAIALQSEGPVVHEVIVMLGLNFYFN